VPFAAISLAERWISSSIAGILIATIPLIIALISRFFGVHERFGPWRVMGLLVGLSGVVTLLGLGSISGPLGWVGVGCMLLASIGYAVGPLIVQRHLKLIDPFGPIAASLLVAALILLPAALCSLPAQMPSALALISVAVLGVVCTALAMLLMFYLITHAGAARASVITYINPAVASLLGVAILHEHLGVGRPDGARAHSVGLLARDSRRTARRRQLRIGARTRTKCGRHRAPGTARVRAVRQEPCDFKPIAAAQRLQPNR
jgi:drug/metabolite transporter (DMT)-like permease